MIRALIAAILLVALWAFPAQAATLVVTYAFPSNSMGFVATAGTSSVMAWNTAALRSALSTKNVASSVNRWDLPTTWVGLGVPAGATITGVTSASMQSQCTVYTSPGANHTSGTATLTDGATVITLSTARVFSAVDGAPVTTNGTNLTGLSLPAADSINLRINNTISTANTAGASMTIFQDTLTFTITYTPATPSTGAPNFFPGRL